MARFNTRTAHPVAGQGSVLTTTDRATTHEGGLGYRRDPRSELYLLALTNLVGQQSFYESAALRDGRFVRLVHQVTATDPEWLAEFLPWLRQTANLRSAPLVAAAEYVRAGGPHGRRVISSVLRRSDEPGELLAYWTARYGRQVPQSLKRGIADSLVWILDERTAIKYDTDSHGYRLGDLLDLTHPRPATDQQSDLFRWLIDRRHGRDIDLAGYDLPVVTARAALEAVPVAERRALLGRSGFAEDLRAAGATWEWLSSWLSGPMDAAAWEAILPSMGYMAVLRNLRNFDAAGVSDAVAQRLADRLADPDQVARSRQLPLRFLSAYRAVGSDRWSLALDRALEHSLANVPSLAGRTLILVDTSSSMSERLSGRSDLARWDAAAVFGIALGRRCGQADVVSYSGRSYYHEPTGARTRVFDLRPGEGLLRAVGRWQADGYFLGGGTETEPALRRHFAGHDRVVIVTDEQADAEVGQALPRTTPLYTWNLAGYQVAHTAATYGRVTFGGLSDAGFVAIDLLERGRDARWPWQSEHHQVAAL